MVAFEWFNRINNLPDIISKHREFLKMYEGKKFGYSLDGNMRKGFKWTETSYKDELFNTDINMIGRLENETRIEFDDKFPNSQEKDVQKILQNIEKVKETLKSHGWGYIVSSHQKNSPYIWVQFDRDVSTKEAENFIKWICPQGAEIDLNFGSTSKIFPVLYAVHRKHSWFRELPIEYHEGSCIFYDSTGIKLYNHNMENVKRENGFQYKTFSREQFRETILNKLRSISQGKEVIC